MSDDEKEKGLHAHPPVGQVPYGDDVHNHTVVLQSADKAAELVAGFHGDITEEEKMLVRRKIDLHLMPIL